MQAVLLTPKAQANQKAWLDTIAWSEIGPTMLAMPETDRGYKVIVGSTPEKLILITSYDSHPRRLIVDKDGNRSTAAGRYQLLSKYYGYYIKLLGLHDFSPASQDAIAIQQTKECHALDDVDNGRFQDAILKCAHIWASFPGNTYHQHTNNVIALSTIFTNAGGQLA